MYKKEKNTNVGAEYIQELLPEFFCTRVRIGINNNEGFVSNLVGGCWFVCDVMCVCVCAGVQCLRTERFGCLPRKERRHL